MSPLFFSCGFTCCAHYYDVVGVVIALTPIKVGLAPSSIPTCMCKVFWRIGVFVDDEIQKGGEGNSFAVFLAEGEACRGGVFFDETMALGERVSCLFFGLKQGAVKQN